MRIRLDNEDIVLDEEILDEGKEAVYEEAKRRANGKGRFIVEILVDGEKILDEDAFLSLSGGTDVQFVTQSMREVVSETLKEGRQYMLRLKPGLESVATLFEEGKKQEAQSAFAQALEGIDWLVGAFGKSCFLTQMQADGFAAGDFGDFTADLNANLEEIMNALQEDKTMRVAYLIREHLVPFVGTFAKYWEELAAHMQVPLQ